MTARELKALEPAAEEFLVLHRRIWPVAYPFYQVSVVLDNGARGFTGYATGVGVMAGDLWFIRQDGNPTQDNTSTFRY